MGNKIVKERFRFRTFPTEGSNHNRQKKYVKHYFVPLKNHFSGNEIARFTRNASADLSVIKYLERRSQYLLQNYDNHCRTVSELYIMISVLSSALLKLFLKHLILFEDLFSFLQ